MSYSVSPCHNFSLSPIQFEDEDRDMPSEAISSMLSSRGIFKPRASSRLPSPANSAQDSVFSSFTTSTASPFSPRISAQSPFTPIADSIDRFRESARREYSIPEEETSPLFLREKRIHYLPLDVVESPLAQQLAYSEEPALQAHSCYQDILLQIQSLDDEAQSAMLHALIAAKKHLPFPMDCKKAQELIISHHLSISCKQVTEDLIGAIIDELTFIQPLAMETSSDYSSLSSSLQALSRIAPYFQDCSYLLLPLYDLLKKELGMIPKSILLENASLSTLIEKCKESL